MLADWPDNGLRHSFASLSLAHFQDAAALALEMGRVDRAMLFAHYRATREAQGGRPLLEHQAGGDEEGRGVQGGETLRRSRATRPPSRPSQQNDVAGRTATRRGMSGRESGTVPRSVRPL